MNFFFLDCDVVKLIAGVVAKKLVMIPGYIDDIGTFFCFAKNHANDIVMGLRPLNIFFHAPDIDNVSHKIKIFGFGMFLKVEQVVGFTAFETQVNIGNPNRPEATRLDFIALPCGKFWRGSFSMM